KTWCIAKPSSDQATLLTNINYACSKVDCQIIQKGCPCFNPDYPINHASIAMNLYYQSMGRNVWNCDFKGSGLIVITDPSKSVSILVMATAFMLSKRPLMQAITLYVFPLEIA
ncbi:hypothetical protein Goshw_005490, partial [Gossypium schwendimanii]|nr:hypothetical protein [Gossypium schwendimanii]